MSTTLADVLAAAATLPVADQLALIDHLLQGIDETESLPELSEAWKTEIARRSAEYDAGGVTTVSWQEIRERWRATRNADG